MAKTDKDTARQAHQAELARSGYRIPDNFYRAPVAPAESIEKKAGDGGKDAIAKGAKAESKHGYKGELKTAAEIAEEAKDTRTYDPETGLSIPKKADDEPKSATGPGENKADLKGRKK